MPRRCHTSASYRPLIARTTNGEGVRRWNADIALGRLVEALVEPIGRHMRRQAFRKGRSLTASCRGTGQLQGRPAASLISTRCGGGVRKARSVATGVVCAVRVWCDARAMEIS